MLIPIHSNNFFASSWQIMYFLLEHLKWWNVPFFAGQINPVWDKSNCWKFLPYTKARSFSLSLQYSFLGWLRGWLIYLSHDKQLFTYSKHVPLAFFFQVKHLRYFNCISWQDLQISNSPGYPLLLNSSLAMSALESDTQEEFSILHIVWLERWQWD